MRVPGNGIDLSDTQVNGSAQSLWKNKALECLPSEPSVCIVYESSKHSRPDCHATSPTFGCKFPRRPELNDLDHVPSRLTRFVDDLTELGGVCDRETWNRVFAPFMFTIVGHTNLSVLPKFTPSQPDQTKLQN